VEMIYKKIEKSGWIKRRCHTNSKAKSINLAVYVAWSFC